MEHECSQLGPAQDALLGLAVAGWLELHGREPARAPALVCAAAS